MSQYTIKFIAILVIDVKKCFQKVLDSSNPCRQTFNFLQMTIIISSTQYFKICKILSEFPINLYRNAITPLPQGICSGVHLTRDPFHYMNSSPRKTTPRISPFYFTNSPRCGRNNVRRQFSPTNTRVYSRRDRKESKKLCRVALKRNGKDKGPGRDPASVRKCRAASRVEGTAGARAERFGSNSVSTRRFTSRELPDSSG